MGSEVGLAYSFAVAAALGWVAQMSELGSWQAELIRVTWLWYSPALLGAMWMTKLPDWAVIALTACVGLGAVAAGVVALRPQLSTKAGLALQGTPLVSHAAIAIGGCVAGGVAVGGPVVIGLSAAAALAMFVRATRQPRANGYSAVKKM